MKHQTTPHEIHVKQMVAFSNARFDQYRERTGLNYKDAINEIMRVHGRDGEVACTAMVDAIVDASLHSSVWETERQTFLQTHYPHLAQAEKPKLKAVDTAQTSLF